jgi:uncharacterized protein
MARITVDQQAIARFCQKNHIRKLSLFGSVLRDDFDAGSDIDVLVEFEEKQTPGFFGLAAMQRELTEIIGDRTIDLQTPQALSHYFRDKVVAGAETLYVH